jgi:hypothetical protein
MRRHLARYIFNPLFINIILLIKAAYMPPYNKII